MNCLYFLFMAAILSFAVVSAIMRIPRKQKPWTNEKVVRMKDHENKRRRRSYYNGR